ncbi:sigma-54-dependent Fis family transcriptional regulator [Desulfosarcina alkanivorans]|uniref:Sigma-54-dependent Fis family transcriptional regulator n=1 Tax=Desulfosarcina alkanivorans TaxID=571177 RepID=A0A5K7YQR4_9BACT|nr:sigma 54-interacting transcriptional regulator [Desulfosarcina alkanivorans]BBO70665.1 sigma-54-dependent Fis family transcriptional regulator [Desulfosarcina alkanivorans]
MDSSQIKRLFPDVDPASVSLVDVLADFHEGIMITDAEGVVLYMNAAQARIDDLEIDAAVGKKVTDLYRVDEGFSPTMACLKAGAAVKNLACYYRTHLGRVVNSIHNIYPITSGKRVVGTICYITDYRNIENTFDTVMQSTPPRSVPTYGIAQPVDAAKPKKNGTRYTFRDIVGRSPDLLTAVKAAKLSAESPSPILIYGETGTGKELFAQAVHNRSPRKTHPYMAINCAAIPENLLEGILFGTSAGAFTGAIDKPGLFEKAAGGTLLLDEINSMPLTLQAKLLRFLQERKIRRIGAMGEIDVDLKIISSINVPPHRAIESGGLRSDLFYRLAVVFIQIPPLRQRMGDLNRLVLHFLARKNRKLGKQVSGIDMKVMEAFEQYAWPGNVRELEHVIEGAMNLAGAAKVIELSHLSVPLDKKGGGHALPQQAPGGSRGRIRLRLPAAREGETPGGKTLAEMKTDQEMVSIVSALQETRGNAARAARKLGISPQLMNYKLKRFNIDRKDYR